MKPYPKYKPAGIDWIGEIPEHWELNRLKYEALVQPSNVDKKTNEGEESVLLCNYMDVYKNDFIDSSVKFMEATATEDEIKKFGIKQGDVLVTKDSETPDDIANPAFVKEQMENVLCAYHLTHIRPTRKKLLGEYLFRLFQTPRFNGQFEVNANGVTRFGLSIDVFADAFVPLPSKAEQTAIANYLDKKTAQIDEFIAKKQKLIELLKEERTAIINEAVSGEGKNWERKKLKYVAKLRDEFIEDSDFKIAVENIESGSGKLVNMEDEKVYTGQLSAFKKEDTIFNKLRPYLHKVYFAEKDGGLFGELLIIYSKGELIPAFLFYKLFSKEFIDIVDGSTQGTKMPRANWNDFISQLFISFPKNKQEQTVIVQYIETETQKIDIAISRIEKEIELMQEYRTALISEVVTGKVKVA